MLKSKSAKGRFLILQARASIVAERSEARYPFGKRTLDLNSVGPKTPKNAQNVLDFE